MNAVTITHPGIIAAAPDGMKGVRNGFQLFENLRGPQSAWQKEPVVWLPQLHEDQVNPRSASQKFADTVASQLKIASYIRGKTNYIVAHEGVAAWLENSRGIIPVQLPPGMYHDLFSPKEYLLLDKKLASAQEEATKLFPRGLPSTAEELSLPQQTFLVAHGGAFTLFYLGEISALAPTSTPALERKVANLVKKLVEASARGQGDALWNAPETQRVIIEEREQVLGEMLRTVHVRTGKPLICVYGGLHAPPPGILVDVPKQFLGDLSERAIARLEEQRVRTMGNGLVLVAGALVSLAAALRQRS